MSQNGKGSKRRPGNEKKFRKNYDKAFNKKGKRNNKNQVTLDEGVVKIETKASETRQKRKIKLIKEYTDTNGVEMVVVNIDGAFANKTITKNVYKIMNHDVVDQTRVEQDIPTSEDK